jgi:hypothetical protein
MRGGTLDVTSVPRAPSRRESGVKHIVRRACSVLSVLALVISLGRPVSAQELPWGDVAPRIVGEHVEVAALGLVDARIGSWPARRASARRRGEERARATFATWLDERVRNQSPSVAARAQTVAREALIVDRVRPLADGAAVVVMRVELAQLRAAFEEGRAPL